VTTDVRSDDGRFTPSDREALLRNALAADGLRASSWSNVPGERYAEHSHGYDKVLVVAAGSIGFTLSGSGRTTELAVADRLDLPAGTAHGAIVGADGVVCLEAHLPAGSLGDTAHHRAGWGRQALAPGETSAPRLA